MQEQPSRSERLRRWIDAVAIAAALVLAAVGFVWLVGDYDANFQSCEVAGRMKHGTGRDAPAGLADLARAFDWDHLEMGVPRARFASYFLEIPNFRLRLFLWQYVTPHPSFSYVWIFSLASLGLLYLAARELGFHRTAAASTVAIYGTSIGFLSGIALLHHPAKPMVNVFLIATIYFFARLAKRRAGTLTVVMSPRNLALMLPLIVFGLFLDESGVLLFAVIPALCPALFFRSSVLEDWKTRTSPRSFLRGFFRNDLWAACKNGLYFLLPALVFAVCLLLVVPLIVFFLNYRPYFFFSDANIHVHTPLALSLQLFPVNLFSLVSPSLLVDIETGDHNEVLTWIAPAQVSLPNVIAVALFSLYVAVAGWNCFRHSRSPLLKIAAALVVAHLFITVFFHSTSDRGTQTGFYYANQFAIFFSLLIGLLVNPKLGWFAAAGKVVLILLVANQVQNSHQMCRDSQGGGCYFDELAVVQRKFHQPISAAYPKLEQAAYSGETIDDALVAIEEIYPRGVRGSRQEVERIWQAWRRDREALEKLEAPVSRSSCWLICELWQINRIEQRVRNEGGG